MRLVGRTLTAQTVGEAVARLRPALADAGFGTLTEIDLAATLRSRLGVEVPDQVLLGVCNPTLAYAALQAEPALGVLLPCTVVVRQAEDEIRVELLDPTAMVELTRNQTLAHTAEEVLARIEQALASVAEVSVDV